MSSGRECCLPELQTKNNESRLSFDISDISGEVSGFLAIKSPMPFFFGEVRTLVFKFIANFYLGRRVQLLNILIRI